MPPIIGAVAALAVKAGVGLLLGPIAGSIAGGLVSIASSFLFSGSGKRKAPSLPNFTVAARDRQQTVRSSVEARRRVYGRARISGPLVAAFSTGSANKYLHMVIPLHHGRASEIETVYFNDLPSTDERFSPGGSDKFEITTHLGAPDQAADSNLVSRVTEWTDDHRLRGITYLYVQLEWHEKTWPTGIPNVAADIKGSLVWDPRDTGQDPDDDATWDWSDNPALCILDYLRLARIDGGFGAPDDEIDLDTFIAAANICDELVETTAGSPSEFQERYRCNGIVELDQKPADIIEDLLTALAGDLTYTQGKYRLYAGAYRAPTIDIGESTLRANPKVQPRLPAAEAFNAVRGTYVDSSSQWQPSDYPPVENAVYEAEDGGEQIFDDFELPFEIDPIRAQRLAKIRLERARQGITVLYPGTLALLQVACLDNVRLTIGHFGWTNKIFQVRGWTLTEDGGIDLTLREEASAVYDWNAGEATVLDPAPDTDLPSAFDVTQPAIVTIDSGTDQLILAGDGTIISRIYVNWGDIADGFVNAGGFIEIGYRRQVGSPEGDWQVQRLPGDRQETWLSPVLDGATYEIRARAINSAALPSDWTTETTHVVVGKTEPPTAPASLVATQNGAFVTFQWPAISDLDRAGYEIRFAPAGTSITRLNSTLATSETKGTLITNSALPPGSWVVGIWSIDTSGNYSLTAATATITVVNDNDIISTQSSAPRWPGTLDGLIRHDVSGSLIPDSNTLASAMTDAQLWDQMVYDPVATARYTAKAIDLGFDADGTRVWASITAALGPDESGVVSPDLEVRARDDADAFGAWQPWTVGSIDGRHIEARVDLDTTSGVVVLSGFDVTADVTERTESASSVVVAAGGTPIAFAQRFHLTPAIEVSAKAGAGSPPEVRIANYDDEDAEGFVAFVYDSAGSDVGGTISWSAIGP